MTTPVLVVGAGPVGLVAAARLTRLGVPTRLVDELPAPSPFSKAVVVHARTLEMLEAMGIAGPFIDAGVRITAAEVRSGGKLLVRSLSTTWPAGTPSCSTFPRTTARRSSPNTSSTSAAG